MKFPIEQRMIIGGMIAAMSSMAVNASEVRVGVGLIVGAIFVVGGIILKELRPSQGHGPMAWAEVYEGKVWTVQIHRSRWHTTPLYLGNRERKA